MRRVNGVGISDYLVFCVFDPAKRWGQTLFVRIVTMRSLFIFLTVVVFAASVAAQGPTLPSPSDTGCTDPDYSEDLRVTRYPDGRVEAVFHAEGKRDTIPLITQQKQLTLPLVDRIVNGEEYFELAAKEGRVTRRVLGVAVNDVGKKVDSVGTTVGNVRTDVAGVKSDVVAVKTVVDDVEKKIDNVTSSVGVVKTDVDEVKTVVSEVKTEVAKANTAIGEVKTSVADVKTDIGAVKTAVETVDTKVDAVAVSINELKAELNKLTADDGTLADLRKDLLEAIAKIPDEAAQKRILKEAVEGLKPAPAAPPAAPPKKTATQKATVQLHLRRPIFACRS